MNDLELQSNNILEDERPPNADERPSDEASAVALESLKSVRRMTGRSWLPIIAIIFGFWLFWYLAYSFYGVLNYGSSNVKYLLPRGLVALVGAAISLAIAAVLRALNGSRMTTRALTVIPLAAVGTIVHGVIAMQIWLAFNAMDASTSPAFVMWTSDFIIRFWYFATQCAIILALSYASDVREREDRIHGLQALAHSAQMRALRNQLNPHFLFNALNSIAALISAKRPKHAEAMTENLADFLRLTLALDPQKLITLEEELQLQKLYLDIEKARFPERLRVTVEVPENLLRALIPSLITQPLVENSIKYAIARSTQPVELRIAARCIGNALELVVADSGGDAGAAPKKGARFGLKNVAERIDMHYGDAGQFKTEAGLAGGFRNIIVIPLRLEE